MIPTATSSGTSIHVGTSSSEPRPPQQAVTEQSLQPHTPHPPPEKGVWEKWGPTIFSTISGSAIAGLIGWYSAVMTLRDDIAANRQAISLIQNDLGHYQREFFDVKDEVKNIATLARDVEVIKLRLESQTARDAQGTSSKR